MSFFGNALTARKLLLPLCLVTGLVLAIVGIAFEASFRLATARTSMQQLVLPEPILTEWLQKTLLIPDESFNAVDGLDDLLVVPFVESRAALGIFLLADVDPYRGGQPASWRVHSGEAGGADLLKTN